MGELYNEGEKVAVGRFPYRSQRRIEALFDLLRFTLKREIPHLDIQECVLGLTEVPNSL